MTLKWDPQPATKESVRISLEGVQSVMIDAEVLAEYRTTIEELNIDLDATISETYDRIKRIKGWWREEEAKASGLERWRKSL